MHPAALSLSSSVEKSPCLNKEEWPIESKENLNTFEIATINVSMTLKL